MAEKRQGQQRGINVSLNLKLLIGFTLVFSLVFAAAYYWFYQFGTQMALGRIREDLEGTLHAAIEGVNGDEFDILVKKGTPDEIGVPSDDLLYTAHQQWLATVMQIEPRLRSAYTFVKGDWERGIHWIGDTYRITDPADMTVFMEPYTVTPDSILLEGFVSETVNMNYRSYAVWLNRRFFAQKLPICRRLHLKTRCFGPSRA